MLFRYHFDGPKPSQAVQGIAFMAMSDHSQAFCKSQVDPKMLCSLRWVGQKERDSILPLKVRRFGKLPCEMQTSANGNIAPLCFLPANSAKHLMVTGSLPPPGVRAVACGPGRRSTSVMLGHACEMLAVMYLQRGPQIAENETTTHRTHRTQPTE